MGKLEQNINVQKMVQDRVNSFSSEKLEHLLNELMKKEFRFIEIVGAVLGFLIGCFQLGFPYLQLKAMLYFHFY